MERNRARHPIWIQTSSLQIFSAHADLPLARPLLEAAEDKFDGSLEAAQKPCR
jgi:hypothetical protein